VDFQSSNDPDMGYRQGIYGLMAAQKYRRPVRQVVIYLGKARMRMPRSLDTGGVQVNYRLIDMRELDSKALLESGSPGDYPLALLAARRRDADEGNRCQGEQIAGAEAPAGADTDADPFGLALGIGAIDNGV
jgi:hypothetical protein